MNEDPIMFLHLGAALVALVLGIINLASVKGTPRHRAIGWIWIAAMLAVTLPSFGLREINPGGFSWIHGLTVTTLVAMVGAIVAARRGRVRAHKQMMLGMMSGLTIAGVFTLMPGRFLGNLLFFGG
ncbi:MAG: DUF2306 domain-containing protein [Alphaproteobacteria bacterium]|jgi:uncharacterized membrane protein|nr:DUF2306 domain-containing protein [Alphaproteobacteria bacterium]